MHNICVAKTTKRKRHRASRASARAYNMYVLCIYVYVLYVRTYVRTYARACGAFMQLPRSKFGPSQLACLCYGERKKVVVIPEDKDINDISYLSAEFRKHFDYESNVSIRHLFSEMGLYMERVRRAG